MKNSVLESFIVVQEG